MATVEFELKDGVMVGDKQEKLVVLRELTAGEIIECGQESEKVAMSPSGPVLVQSPVLMGLHTLCKQIKSIGSLPGPVEPMILEKLSESDFALLQIKAAEFSQTIMKRVEELAERGRPAGDGDTD